MTTNLFVIANVKQLRTDGSFRILLPLFRTSCGVGVLNSAICNSFHNRVEFGTILVGLRNFVVDGGFEHPPTPPPRYATACGHVWVGTFLSPPSPSAIHRCRLATSSVLSNGLVSLMHQLLKGL